MLNQHVSIHRIKFSIIKQLFNMNWLWIIALIKTKSISVYTPICFIHGTEPVQWLIPTYWWCVYWSNLFVNYYGTMNIKPIKYFGKGARFLKHVNMNEIMKKYWKRHGNTNKCLGMIELTAMQYNIAEWKTNLRLAISKESFKDMNVLYRSVFDNEDIHICFCLLKYL